MRRALFVLHLGEVGGPGRSLLPLAESLARNGTEVECLVPPDGQWVAEHYGRCGAVTRARYAALTHPTGVRGALRLARDLAREVRGFRATYRRRRPDVVIVATTSLPAAVVAARMARVPVAVYAAELRDAGPGRRGWARTWGHALALAVARRGDVVVCCSRAVAEQFPRSPRVRVSYPPVPDEPPAADGERARKSLGIAGAEPLVAVVGSLSRGRAQDVALRALPLVQRTLPRARLLVVGAAHPRAVDLEYAEGLRALAADLGVESDVVFAGAVDFMPDVYAAADVVVNPARIQEAFGLAVAESMAAGTPVIACDVGAVREVSEHVRTGLLVPPADPDSLAAAVLRLWQDERLRDRLVRAARHDAGERFSARRGLDAWAGALAGLATSAQ